MRHKAPARAWHAAAGGRESRLCVLVCVRRCLISVGPERGGCGPSLWPACGTVGTRWPRPESEGSLSLGLHSGCGRDPRNVTHSPAPGAGVPPPTGHLQPAEAALRPLSASGGAPVPQDQACAQSHIRNSPGCGPTPLLQGCPAPSSWSPCSLGPPHGGSPCRHGGLQSRQPPLHGQRGGQLAADPGAWRRTAGGGFRGPRLGSPRGRGGRPGTMGSGIASQPNRAEPRLSAVGGAQDPMAQDRTGAGGFLRATG